MVKVKGKVKVKQFLPRHDHESHQLPDMSFPPVTPLRPVPGAFVNTPAIVARYQNNTHDPVRRTLFPSDSQNAQTSTATTTAAQGTVSTSTTAVTATANTEGGGLASLTPLPPPRVENIPPVLKAAKAINAFLQLDESFPDLDSYCRRKFGVLTRSHERRG